MATPPDFNRKTLICALYTNNIIKKESIRNHVNKLIITQNAGLQTSAFFGTYDSTF